MRATAAKIRTSADHRIAAGLFFLVFVCYAYFFAGGGWSQNGHFALTRALVERQTIRLDAFTGTTGDVVTRDGHVYFNKPPGLSLIAAPVYAIAVAAERASGADPSAPLFQTINAWLCTLFACGIPAALVAPVLFLYARRREGLTATASLFLALVIALATEQWPYATLFMLHAASGALMLFAYVLLEERGWNRPFAAGLLAGLAALANYLCAPVIGGIALLSLRGERRGARLAWFVAGAAPGVALLLWYQVAAFGALFRIPSSMNDAFVSRDALFGVLRMPSAEALWGVTVSPYRGLFYIAPVLLLAAGGIVAFARRRAWIELASVAVALVVFFGFNLTFNNWDGGFGIGARYLVPLIPLLGILMIPMTRVMRPLWIALAIVSFAQVFAATAVDPQPSGSIPRPMSDYILPLLVRGSFTPTAPLHPSWAPEFVNGHTSVVRHTIDQIIPFTKHPPGSPESEWASFNLGEIVAGPGSALSLLPILLVLACGIVVLWLHARSADLHETRTKPGL